MNIKQHIEAGHYPTDDKGRARVPMTSGRWLVVTATDKPGPCPIIGWIEGIYHATGYYADAPDLLPPPPRKVKVTGYARVIAGTRCLVNVYEKRLEAAQDLGPRETLVELTGEYEQGWE